MSWLLVLLLFTGGLLALALLRGITITRLLKEWTGVAGKNLDELAPEWREAFFLQLVSGKVARSVVRPRFSALLLRSYLLPCSVYFPFAFLAFINGYP